MNISNPILFLKKGFLYPEARVSVHTSFRGCDFKIIESGSGITPIVVPQGDQGGILTSLRYLWMAYSKDTDNVYDIFDDLVDIINIISLLLGKYYIDINSLDVYAFNPGGLRYNASLDYPADYSGIAIDDILVTNTQFIDIFQRINNLSQGDYSYFRSAAYLLKDAKKRFFRGENSGAVADAVSAIEALYLRPNSRGIFNEPDARFIPPGVNQLADRFAYIFCSNIEATNLFNSFSPSLYAIRSGHLHSGKLDFYLGAMPRPENDKFLDAILHCQNLIFTSLTTFGV